MVSYSNESKTIKCYHPLAHNILINKDVKFDEQKCWHSPIDSSSKPFVSLKQISNCSMVIEIIDPPTTTTSHYLFNPTMDHVKPREVTTTQQPLHVYVYHKCINMDIVDNFEQPSTLGNGLFTAINVATPTTNLEDVPSPSLDSIVVDFAMFIAIDSPTLEPYVH
jgi:hypothetical protein